MNLTANELVVLDHICDGLCDKEIAAILAKPVDTVKHYQRRARLKLGLRNRVQLAIYHIMQKRTG